MMCIMPMAYHGIFFVSRSSIFYVHEKLREKIHVVYPDVVSSVQAILHPSSDGRVIFVYTENYLKSGKLYAPYNCAPSRPKNSGKISDKNPLYVHEKEPQNRLRCMLILTQAKSVLP